MASARTDHDSDVEHLHGTSPDESRSTYRDGLRDILSAETERCPDRREGQGIAGMARCATCATPRRNGIAVLVTSTHILLLDAGVTGGFRELTAACPKS